MAFCEPSIDSIAGGFTSVDNTFFKDFLPLAPEAALRVYLYGLFLCGKPQDINTEEQMRRELNLAHDDILDAYTYWEECGLINICCKDPLSIEYIGTSGRNLLKKVSAGKYKTFNKQMQQTLCGRMISINEYSEYYTFLENSFFDPNALVEIAKYCADIKGNDIGYAYILKIARDWDKAGYRTAEKIREKIKTQNFYNQELSAVFKALGTKRSIDIDDRRMYQKWTEEMGFSFEVIEALAKLCKRKGVSGLDALLSKYYKLHLFSIKEIDLYEQTKEQNRELAIDVNRALGLYYADTTGEIEEYIVPWLSKGFSPATIKMVAKFCFRCRIQTLEGLSAKLNGFAQRGLVNEQSILSYTEEVLAADGRIAEILDTLGIVRGVCAADRKNFKTWQEWGATFEVMLFAAKQCSSLFFPMASLNKALAELKQSGELTIAGAQKFFTSPKNTILDDKKEGAKDNQFLAAKDRSYSTEQLNALFDRLKEE